MDSLGRCNLSQRLHASTETRASVWQDSQTYLLCWRHLVSGNCVVHRQKHVKCNKAEARIVHRYVEMDEADAAQQLGINLTEDCVTCEVPFGGALLLNNLIPHRQDSNSVLNCAAPVCTTSKAFYRLGPLFLCRSLSNKSQQIRWSLDLRFQRLKEPNGFYGLKPCIALRKQDEPHLTIDWSTWANLDRNTLQSDAISTDTKAQAGLLAQSGKL